MTFVALCNLFRVFQDRPKLMKISVGNHFQGLYHTDTGIIHCCCVVKSALDVLITMSLPTIDMK